MQKSENEKYQMIGSIGRGRFGTIYLARNLENQEKVAIKKIRFAEEENGIPSVRIREISINKILKHPNIVNLLDIITKEYKILLVFEHLDYDLKTYLQYIIGEIDQNTVKYIIFQILEGINYCHSRSVLHRDLKPDHIVIDKNLNVKLINFSLARTFGVPEKLFTLEIQSLWYKAPEILFGQREYSTPVDIWSIGCIFYEVACRSKIYIY
jgi:serine/threonine protein kinase